MSSLGLLATPAMARIPTDPRDTRFAPRGTAYVTPDGTGSGTSWDDAAPLVGLNRLIEAVGPGGTVLLLADGGDYTVSAAVGIETGGGPDDFVTIAGVDRNGQPMAASLRGTRKPWEPAESQAGAVNAAEFGGNTLFSLSRRASFIRIANLAVADFGSVLGMAGHTGSGIMLEDVQFTNIRDGVYTDEDSRVTDVVLRRFSGRGFSKKAVRFHGECANWLIEDCDLDSAWQYGDNFAVGIEAHDAAHGLHIVGGSTRNSMDTQGDDEEEYWNGDGVASERDNYDIVIENHTSSGHTDSGYDLKSESTVLRNCVAEDSKRNYRLWGGIGAEPMYLTGCTSRSPRKRGGSGGAHHIWLSGAADIDDNAGSVLYVDGVLAGGGAEKAIYADGGNAAVHLVDTDTSGLEGGGVLFEATGKTSKLVVGSANDAGIDAILSEPEVTIVAASVKTVPLLADGEVSWRIFSTTGAVEGKLDGEALTLAGAAAGETGEIVVQARDSRGEATRLTIATQTIENPVAPGAVLSLAFGSEAGQASLTDATGMHVIRLSEEAEIADNRFVFDGKKSYFEVDNSANFDFDGAFTIEADIEVDKGEFSLPADIITVWKTSAHRRSFRVGLSEDGAISFYWSTSGRAQEGNVLSGPVLESGRTANVIVDRGESGIMRLYVDGVMVDKTPEPVEALHASNAPLRVSGRSDGKQSATGMLGSLTIIKGFAKCDSDEGCAA